MKELSSEISEFMKLKNIFAANIAESINNVKVSVVKAELAMNMFDMEGIKKNYTYCQQENGNLIAEYMKRKNNHEAFTQSLKSLNSYIMKAAALRLGSFRQDTIKKCRDLVKAKKQSDISLEFLVV